MQFTGSGIRTLARWVLVLSLVTVPSLAWGQKKSSAPAPAAHSAPPASHSAPAASHPSGGGASTAGHSSGATTANHTSGTTTANHGSGTTTANHGSGTTTANHGSGTTTANHGSGTTTTTANKGATTRQLPTRLRPQLRLPTKPPRQRRTRARRPRPLIRRPQPPPERRLRRLQPPTRARPPQPPAKAPPQPLRRGRLLRAVNQAARLPHTLLLPKLSPPRAATRRASTRLATLLPSIRPMARRSFMARTEAQELCQLVRAAAGWSTRGHHGYGYGGARLQRTRRPPVHGAHLLPWRPLLCLRIPRLLLPRRLLLRLHSGLLLWSGFLRLGLQSVAGADCLLVGLGSSALVWILRLLL